MHSHEPGAFARTRHPGQDAPRAVHPPRARSTPWIPRWLDEVGVGRTIHETPRDPAISADLATTPAMSVALGTSWGETKRGKRISGKNVTDRSDIICHHQLNHKILFGVLGSPAKSSCQKSHTCPLILPWAEALVAKHIFSWVLGCTDLGIHILRRYEQDLQTNWGTF